jgi:hypothetical protein
VERIQSRNGTRKGRRKIVTGNAHNADLCGMKAWYSRDKTKDSYGREGRQ